MTHYTIKALMLLMKKSILCFYLSFYLFTQILENCLGTAILNVGVRGTHSVTKNMSQIGFQVKILPALSDNYMYLVSISL